MSQFHSAGACPVRHAGLEPHPQSGRGAVDSIRVRIGRAPDATLEVTFILEGELETLRVPPPRARRFADRLWEHTCFEVFIGRAGARAYHELNFAPSGEWAAYAFAGYREGMSSVDAGFEPQMHVSRTSDKLQLDTAIPLDLLTPQYAGATLAVALSAVVENSAGVLAYWALAHPPGKPDFHHADSYTLEVPAPAADPSQP